MKAIRYLLKDYLKNNTFQSGLDMARLIERWPEVVGEYLAQRLIPVSFEKGILFCQVKQSTLVQEFSFVEYEVLAKLRRLEDGVNIQGIRLVSRAPVRQQEQKALLKIRQAEKQHQAYLSLKKQEQLDPQTQAAIEMQTQSISDQMLQNKAQSMMQAMARRQEELKQQQWKSCGNCQSFYEPFYRTCPYCRLSDG